MRTRGRLYIYICIYIYINEHRIHAEAAVSTFRQHHRASFKRDTKLEVSNAHATKMKRQSGLVAYILDLGSPFAPTLQSSGDEHPRRVRLFEIPVDAELPPEDTAVPYAFLF